MPDGIDIRPLRTATFQADIYHAQLEAINRARVTSTSKTPISMTTPSCAP